MKKNHIFHFLIAIVASLLAVVSLCLWFLFYDLYWQHRGDFNAAGRYFDAMSGVMYHDQSWLLIVPVLGFLLASLLFAVLFARLWWRCHSKKTIGATE